MKHAKKKKVEKPEVQETVEVIEETNTQEPQEEVTDEALESLIEKVENEEITLEELEEVKEKPEEIEKEVEKISERNKTEKSTSEFEGKQFQCENCSAILEGKESTTNEDGSETITCQHCQYKVVVKTAEGKILSIN